MGRHRASARTPWFAGRSLGLDGRSAGDGVRETGSGRRGQGDGVRETGSGRRGQGTNSKSNIDLTCAYNPRNQLTYQWGPATYPLRPPFARGSRIGLRCGVGCSSRPGSVNPIGSPGRFALPFSIREFRPIRGSLCCLNSWGHNSWGQVNYSKFSPCKKVFLRSMFIRTLFKILMRLSRIRGTGLSYYHVICL